MHHIEGPDMRRALHRLGTLAQERGIHLELTAVGGAVMVLKYGARPGTRDVDAVETVPPLVDVEDLIRQVAQEEGRASRFVSVPLRGDELLSGPGIRVWSVRADQMLALKIAAMRDDVDRRDAAVLARDLGFTTRDLLCQAIDAHIQDPAVHRDASYNVDEVLDALSEDS